VKQAIQIILNTFHRFVNVTPWSVQKCRKKYLTSPIFYVNNTTLKFIDHAFRGSSSEKGRFRKEAYRIYGQG